MGATHTINYKTNPNWDAAVLDLTDGKGVDLVVEVGGAGTIDRSVKAAKHGGHVALIGVLSLPDTPFNVINVLMKSVTVQGVFVGSRAMFEDLNTAITAHKIKPVVDRVFQAKDIVQALEYMESGSHFGKIVLKF